MSLGQAIQKIFDYIADYNLAIHFVGFLLIVEAGVFGGAMLYQFLFQGTKPDGTASGIMLGIGGLGVSCLGVGQWKSK